MRFKCCACTREWLRGYGAAEQSGKLEPFICAECTDARTTTRTWKASGESLLRIRLAFFAIEPPSLRSTGETMVRPNVER